MHFGAKTSDEESESEAGACDDICCCLSDTLIGALLLSCFADNMFVCWRGDGEDILNYCLYISARLFLFNFIFK